MVPENLYEGMTIYHKTNKTKAQIISVNETNVTIELIREIAHKKILTLPITHIGEWLFFNDSDIELSIDLLSDNLDYLKYKNPKIMQAHNEKLERQRRSNPSTEGVIKSFNSLFEKLYPAQETLLRIKRNQENYVREIITKRKIEYLVHFTRIENLHSILLNGLVPVSIQGQMELPSLHNDEQRIDYKLDCTSCSIGFPNYKLFFKFRGEVYPNTRWVIIVLDKDILFSPTNIAYYYKTNAASILPRVDLCTAKALENMFCEFITTKNNKMINRNSLQIDDSYPTDPQAEILISGIINVKYIAGICFESQRDINDYIIRNGDNILNKFDYQIIPCLYEPRKDYRYWKKEL